MKSITIDKLTDKVIGKIGTSERNNFEYELKMDVLGHVIKAARKKKQLTQTELGKLVGVQKSQISKLENNTKNFRIGTIMKVLDALGATVKLHVELENQQNLVIN